MKTLTDITQQTLIDLTDKEHDACISLYMPMVEAGPETRQNTIRFKTLYQNAEQKMEKYGMDQETISEFIAPLEKLENDTAFWEDRSPGLAVFLCPHDICVYKSEMPFEEEAVVDKNFYIRPLLTELDQNKTFTVLLINPDEPRLMKCNNTACKNSRSFPGYLESMEKFLSHHDFEESLQHNTSREAPHFHGQGTAGDKDQENQYMSEYYKQLKNWLHDNGYINDTNTLWLIGDDRSTGIFTKISESLSGKTPVLLQKNVSGEDDDKIHEAIQQHVTKFSYEADQEELETFQNQANDDEISTLQETKDIVTAAHDKRISKLFVPSNSKKIWGTFKAESHETIVRDDATKEVGEELYNLAAIKTLQNGGSVVTNDNIPEDKTLAVCHW